MRPEAVNLLVPSPIEKVNFDLLGREGIDLQVKREDRIHPEISGNKWRKLKYNLADAHQKGINQIVTFGGAFSNHIHATAAACQAYSLKSLGIIRGEFDPRNPTLQFAQSCGMELRFVDRSSYRDKERSPAIQSILSTLDNYLLVPEGGSNALAYQGLKELAEEINDTECDIVLVSAGTGCTAAGILKWLHPTKELWVFSSLKSEHLHQEIRQKVDSSKHTNLRFFGSYHFGGYGKSPEPLIHFINSFYDQSRIPLDPIYNGKLVSGFCDLVAQNQIDTEKSYLWIHTGGLQGAEAYNYMAAKKNRIQILIN